MPICIVFSKKEHFTERFITLVTLIKICEIFLDLNILMSNLDYRGLLIFLSFHYVPRLIITLCHRLTMFVFSVHFNFYITFKLVTTNFTLIVFLSFLFILRWRSDIFSTCIPIALKLTFLITSIVIADFTFCFRV